MVQKDGEIRRGRPRAYDPDEALSEATAAFWRAGYAATSLDDLSEATGMNRPSLYGAFGDKRALYLATLERYVSQARARIAEALDLELPLADALRRFYASALALYLPAAGTPRGCYLIGTAATEAVRDPEVRSRLGAALREFDAALEERIRYARARGELDAAAGPAELASIASAVLHSLAIRARAGDSRASLEALIDSGVWLICGMSARDGRKARARRATRAGRRPSRRPKK